MKDPVTRLLQRRELIGLLVARNLKIRYKNSFLGFFWTLLGPIFMIAIYALFLHLLKIAIPLPELVTGIFVWQFLALCLGDSLHAILGNANLVTKSAFPRAVLPFSMVLANLVNFLLSLGVLIVYLLIVGWFRPFLFFGLPLVVLTHFALCAGFALLLSASNVFFRDTEHILHTVLMAWFFLSPIIYPFSFVRDRLPEGWPPEMLSLYFLNPMAGIVTAYRNLFMSTDLVEPRLIAVSFAVAWLIFLVGFLVFHRLEPRFGDEL